MAVIKLADLTIINLTQQDIKQRVKMSITRFSLISQIKHLVDIPQARNIQLYCCKQLCLLLNQQFLKGQFFSYFHTLYWEERLTLIFC